jgi:hypothetical protein
MTNEVLEAFYESVILPNYAEVHTKNIQWKDHGRTGPDTWAHHFIDENDIEYVLVFDDYYINGSFLDDNPSHNLIRRGDTDFIRFGSEPPYKYIENVTGYFSLYEKNSVPAYQNKRVDGYPKRTHGLTETEGVLQITTVDMSREVLRLADHLHEKNDSFGEELLKDLITRLYEEAVDDVAFSSLDILRYIEMLRDSINNGDESKKEALATLKDDLTNPNNYFKHAIRDIEKDLYDGIEKHVLTNRYEKYDGRSFSASQALIWRKLWMPFESIGCDLDCSACLDSFVYEAKSALKSLELYRKNPSIPTIPSIIATYERIDGRKTIEGASVTLRFRNEKVEVVEGSLLAKPMSEYIDEKQIDTITNFIPAYLPDRLDDWILNRDAINRHMFFEYEI